MTSDDDAIVRLRSEHPCWGIGRFSVPREVGDEVWVATRNRVLTTDEMRDGLAHTLVEESAEGLRKALAQQDNIALDALPGEPV
jgi:hypothetical protein